MHKYTIKKLLDIPEYKVTEIISNTEKEIHIRLEPYKRKDRIVRSDSDERSVSDAVVIFSN